MSEAFDVVVVGAGPGGLAAAATAAEAGLKVCLVDDNPAPGGQIWRQSVLKGTNPDAARWVRRLESHKVDVRSGCCVVLDGGFAAGRNRILRIESDGGFADVAFGALILATGAREMFLPFPGWTLPGVFGAGGLQAFVKSGLDIAGKRVVVAGTGPLLLAVAANLRAAGARIAAIVEQAPLSRLARFSLGLLFGEPGKLVEGAKYGLKNFGTRHHTGAWVTRALPTGTCSELGLGKVTVASVGGTFEVEAELLALGFHLLPNTELAQLLHCRLEQGYLEVDSFQQSSVESIYGVGELTGIGGVEKAQVEGRIAALAVAGRSEQARTLFPARDRWMRFARRLDAAFALRNELRELADANTIICRCEDVSRGELTACRSWREAKLHTRCGMGPCQGRICGPAAHFLFGWTLPAPRPPVFPVGIATLMDPCADTHGEALPHA